MSFDIIEIAEVLRAAAKAEVLPRFRRLSSGDIQMKTEPIDLVTAGDLASERFIRQRIAALLPEAQFIGEEAVAADPVVLETVFDADLAVLVDPIDGTANFVSGLPLFGIMAAIARRGETIAGILYDPFADDFVLAERGSGAYVVLSNGERQALHVAESLPLDRKVGSVSTEFLPADTRPRVLANLAKVRAIACHRCACHEYRAFISGHTQFAMFSKLNPWDHMAGTLIATEAGAHVACFDGMPYDASKRDIGLLMATSKDSWDELMGEVFSV